MNINGNRYETSDVEAKWAILFVLILVTGCVAMHFSLILLQHIYGKEFASQDQKIQERGMPAALTKTRPNFPEPRLQIFPRTDLEALRARENAGLTGYAWIDKTAGIARIPIERAMQLVVERGLPGRNGTNGKSILELQQERASRRDKPIAP